MLTNDEMKIFRLIAKGYSNKEINKTLEIPESTIGKIIKSILEKTGARNKVHLAYLAAQMGLRIDE